MSNEKQEESDGALSTVCKFSIQGMLDYGSILMNREGLRAILSTNSGLLNMIPNAHRTLRI
jgi:hypothetical protein